MQSHGRVLQTQTFASWQTASSLMLPRQAVVLISSVAGVMQGPSVPRLGRQDGVETSRVPPCASPLPRKLCSSST